MRGLTELYLAYSLIWLGLMAYLVYLNWKQRKLGKDLQALKGALEHGAGK